MTGRNHNTPDTEGSQTYIFDKIINIEINKELKGINISYNNLIKLSELNQAQYNAINNFYDKYKRYAVGSWLRRSTGVGTNKQFFPDGPPSSIFKCVESIFSRIGKGLTPCQKYINQKHK